MNKGKKELLSGKELRVLIGVCVATLPLSLWGLSMYSPILTRVDADEEMQIEMQGRMDDLEKAVVALIKLQKAKTGLQRKDRPAQGQGRIE